MEKKMKAACPECANCNSTDKIDGQPLDSCARCRLVSYCSRNCQIQHWKSGGHRKFCVTPEERSVQALAVKFGKAEAEVKVGDDEEHMCPVCMGQLDTSITTLPCSHVIHTQCMDDLRAYGASNVCPSCRAELPSRSKISDHGDKKCANCGISKSGNKNKNTLLDCSRCKSVSYCGPECQAKHWKEGGHQKICGKLQTNPITKKGDQQNELIEKELMDLLRVLLLCNKAKSQKHKAKVIKVIAKRADWSVTSSKGPLTPITCAAFTGNVECIALLLQAGADVENKARGEANLSCTPLFMAAEKGHAECVSLLLEAGADVNNDSSEEFWMPLMTAANNGHDKCIPLLLKAGADVHHTDTNGYTSLCRAIEKGHRECVALLLEGGSDVHHITEGVNPHRYTPLLLAIGNGHDKCIPLLLEAGADVHTVQDGTTPLLSAAFNGKAKCSSILIEAGADVNKYMDSTIGGTPLFMAAAMGHHECISILLKSGADVHIFLNENGYTPLLVAAQEGHAECVQLLLKAGAGIHHNKHSARDLAVDGKKSQWRKVVKLLDAHTAGLAPGGIKHP